ncbi:MAG: hypothetical protein ACOY3P_07940 [Planctomycetota bacterium]
MMCLRNAGGHSRDATDVRPAGTAHDVRLLLMRFIPANNVGTQEEDVMLRTRYWTSRLILSAMGVMIASPCLTAATAAEKVAIKPGQICLRILLGVRDKEPTRWDGSIDAGSGRVVQIAPWRKGKNDVAEGNAWKVATEPAPRFVSSQAKKKAFPPNENGVVVVLEGVGESSQIQVTTEQGKFSFRISEVLLGKPLNRLGGRAEVARLPVSYQLTAEATEEDFPAAAVSPDGSVWVSYVAFTHSEDFAKPPRFRDSMPTDEELAKWDQPTGGDRVWAMRLANNEWSAPIAVTPGKQDIYKSAIAIDGKGRPWVFWSEQVDGNFDLYGSTYDGANFGKPLRMTRHPDPDINPVAATDAEGRVWLAWQGFRETNSNIYAVCQAGDTFSKELTVADSPANDWMPAIAASKRGGVAIAWDTYENGNYDVFMRVASSDGSLGQRLAVAETAAQEVRPALSFDGKDRLWVAFEQGPEDWGKDFGALVRDKGNPLYGGGPRFVVVKCFEGDRPLAPAGRLESVLGAMPKGKAERGREKGEERSFVAGEPLSLPRLAVDADGRVWLSYRSKNPLFWSGVGTTWFSYLTFYEGDQWSEPIFVENSDAILDNRPAFVAMPDGRMLLVGSCDQRKKVGGYRGADNQETPQGDKAEPVNFDIFVSFWQPPTPDAQAPKLTANESPVGVVTVSNEASTVARCREYRVDLRGTPLQLMRGEFHRHTEYSSDGGGDGSLMDMYRYGLDAVSMDWIGNGDHDNNGGREYPWWITQKTVDAYTVGKRFVPLYSYERSVTYPDGHRNPIFAKRGVHTLPRFGKPGRGDAPDQPEHTPDTLMLYRYLAMHDGICASHTSATNMGTDWRDNDPKVEPVVEIYQGCRQNYEEPGAPRAPSADDAIGGFRPMGFVWRALEKGYRLGFQASSDHVSTHISYCNIWTEAPTREAMHAAMKQRHCYGATDSIIADVRCGDYMMGDEFTLNTPPTLRIKLIGTGPFKQVDIVKDNTYVYTTRPGKQEVAFEWTDKAPKSGLSYYYVRGEQEDGEIVWVSPMWIQYRP